MLTLTVNTDGGSRGNPGQAAVGVVITDGTNVWEHKRCIGIATNNVAEYTGVVDALGQIEDQNIARQGISKVIFNLDSELVVKQLRKEYRVKDPGMQQLNLEVQKKLQQLSVPYEFVHVPRAHNKRADQLVNQALDAI